MTVVIHYRSGFFIAKFETEVNWFGSRAMSRCVGMTFGEGFLSLGCR